MIDREALRAEVLRVHARYVSEVVEALGFCPWAAVARRQGRVRTVAILGESPTLESVLEDLRALERDDNTDIGLLVLPEVVIGRVEFQHFAARVRAGYESVRAADGFAIADFHPDAAPDLASPARLVPFIRRSPDPTLQLVRRSTLDAARRGEPSGTKFVDADSLAQSLEPLPPENEPVHARLARENLDLVQHLGVEHVTAVLDDIQRDRDLSYQRLGIAPPPWSPMRRGTSRV
jgi:hypothetical protein